MPHCTVTIESFTCTRAREPSGDKFFLRWAFHVDGSRAVFNRRPPSGYWTLGAGATQSLSDTVVDQSIFANTLYWFHLELWTDDSSLSLAARLNARMRHLLHRWGLLSFIPGAGFVAFLAALFGAGSQDVPMGAMQVPIIVMEMPAGPPTGIGPFAYTAVGRVANTEARSLFTGAVT